MRLTLRQIRYVAEVADRGSIQSAARSLGISQSSILAAIDVAEAELGASIFVRRPSQGVRLTTAGDRFVTAARGLLSAEADFERAIGAAGEKKQQSLRIGCFEPFGPIFLPQVLSYYSQQVGTHAFDLFEADIPQLRQWLESGFVDIVVAYDLGLGPGFGDSVSRICSVPPHALLPAGHELAQQTAVTLAEIASLPLVLLDLPQSGTYLLTLFDILAKRPEVRFRTRSYETVRSAVSAGFGASILNMRPLGGTSADTAKIVRRPILDDLPAPVLVVADTYGANKPAYVRAFVDAMRTFFRVVGPEHFTVTLPDRAARVFEV